MQKSPPPYLFAVALKQLAKSEELIKTRQTAKLYDGYLSALGPTVRQIGLVPALANYTAESKSARAKAPLIRYLQNIMADPDANLFAQPQEDNGPVSKKEGITLRPLTKEETPTLFEKVGNLRSDQRLVFQRNFEQVLVAAKLALRTYLPLSSTQNNIVDYEEE